MRLTLVAHSDFSLAGKLCGRRIGTIRDSASADQNEVRQLHENRGSRGFHEGFRLPIDTRPVTLDNTLVSYLEVFSVAAIDEIVARTWIFYSKAMLGEGNAE